jgi:hypothetical protein
MPGQRKRCKFCGREGVRMTIDNHIMFGPPPPGREQWKCHEPIACIRRQERIGKWLGKRVLTRLDLDGTHWTIRRHDDHGLRGMVLVNGPWLSGYVLICEHRDHRCVSHHSSIEAAKAHADEMVDSLTTGKADDYRDAEPPQQAEAMF